MRHQRKVYLEFLVATACASILYLPFRSTQWDLNGLTEAQAIDSSGVELISRNHLLYRPLGFTSIALARWFGYEGHSAEILQFITVALACVGVGLFWVWVRTLTGNALAASIAGAFLATTWAFWTFSTDAYYITPAAAAVAGALLLVSSPTPLTHRAVIKLGFLVALSILLWQANIFLIPTIVFGLLRTRRATSPRQTLYGVGLFLFIVGVIVGSAYAAASTQISHLSSVRDFAHWLSSHGSEGSVPIWGKWSADRIPAAARTALESFIPLQETGGLKKAFKGVFFRDKLLVKSSFAALVILFTITCAGAIRKREVVKPAYLNLIWLGVAYCSYLPFIIWWDPYEPKWFVIPNLFLIAALAQVWSILFAGRGQYVLIGVCVAVIAAANFVYTIWPRHSRPNPSIRLAQCVAANTTDKDTVVVTDWNWSGYANYFFGYKGETLLLIGGTTDKSDKVQLIVASIAEARAREGHVYMKDLNTYSPVELAFIASLTGFTPTDFDVFERRDAFSCENSKFLQLIRIK